MSSTKTVEIKTRNFTVRVSTKHARYIEQAWKAEAAKGSDRCGTCRSLVDYCVCNG